MSPKVKTFCERLFSTVVLLGVLGGALWWDEPAGYAVLVCLLCNLTSVEWFHMLHGKKDEVCRPVILLLSLIYPWLQTCMLLQGDSDFFGQMSALLGFTATALAYPVLYTLILFFCGLFRMDYRGKSGAQMLSGMGIGLLAFVYPVWLFSFALAFTAVPAAVSVLLVLILATKMSDIWAYVCGMLTGGKFISRKFSPSISPKKTWEGIIGSFMITSAATYGLLSCMPDVAEMIPDGVFCIVMPLIFVLSVAGDLAGSLIKRGIGVKDSGALLPGIGGVFDLIDSPAFTVSALAVVALMSFV